MSCLMYTTIVGLVTVGYYACLKHTISPHIHECNIKSCIPSPLQIYDVVWRVLGMVEGARQRLYASFSI